MKKSLLFGIAVLLAIILAIPAWAQIKVQAEINLPFIEFKAPPALVVLPQTYVYVAPDINVDLFFVDGYWWRPVDGKWYRSTYYDRGWVLIKEAPDFYKSVPPGWRKGYQGHNWKDDSWEYERIPCDKVEKNWKTWKNDKYWEKEKNWGVKGPKLKSGPADSGTKSQEKASQAKQKQGKSPDNKPGKGQGGKKK